MAGHAKPRLTEAPVLLALLAFAAPALGTNILQSLSGSVTMFWVGRLLGPAALSATSNAHLIIGFVTSLLGGVATAAGLLAGQAIGAAAPDRAQAVVRSSLALFVAISLPLAASGALLSPAIVELLAVPAKARGSAVTYLQLLFLAMPVSNLLSLLTALLHGAGNARAPLAATAVLVAFDAGLAPLLIAGAGPWPGAGIGGAGIAYGVAHVGALALLIGLAVRPARALGLDRSNLIAPPDRGIIGWCLRAGTLVGLQFALIAAASVSLMGLVNRYGAEASAAYGVAMTLWSYIQLPLQAVAAAAAAIAAQAVGGAAWTRVRTATLAAAGINVALTGATVAAGLMFSRSLAELVLPGEPRVAALVVEINHVVLWGFLMLAVTMVLFGVLRAVNDVGVPFGVILVSHIGVRVPFAFLLAPTHGLAAVWWSYPVGLGAALILTSIYVVRRPPWRARV